MVESALINYIIVIILGLAIGSFLNVVILRFDDLKTIFTVRSHCPKCKKELRWYELIPFFSYLILRGKCLSCKKPISIQYPLVEAGTALIFTGLFWQFGFSWEFLVYLILVSILIVIFAYDILHQLVADILVRIALIIWVIWIVAFSLVTHHPSLLLDSLYGGLILGGILGILVAASKEKWMGAGDVGLGFLLGAMVSFPNVFVALFAAFVLGAIVGLSLMAFGKKKMKDKVPFAPFLISGMLIALLFGNFIIDWYLGKFL